ncbi:MAG: glycosyltransferase family 1 protein [Rhodovarius sp.]|nr:glycosyltransferase family 4 protein [Rhodovarius sp.]MCX7933548.1 glycosyltransferase family 4 protein [Rhodovarius sp.]MDW8313700.1 glycosyltransferase family 1 protein [Rhodovarius sp.]
MHILFDTTLIVMLPFWAQPSGIDRVVFAHARHWAARPPSEVTLVARTPTGRLTALPEQGGRDFLAAVAEGIAGGRRGAVPALKAKAAALMAGHLFGEGRGRARRALARAREAVLLNASGHLLHAPRAVAEAKALGARFVPLLHDNLPLSHPEYSPANGAARHRARMLLVSAQADGAIAVSAASRDACMGWFAAQGLRCPPFAVAHPGLDLPRLAGSPPPQRPRPWCVMLSTLAPRKNHLLMLQIWKEEFAQRPEAPDLVIIGRRGWENSTTFALLDRVDWQGRVLELGRLTDAEAQGWIRGARALLFPSIAEGYGIPLAEALAMGVPVLASDIPPFREVGGDVPDYLHPLDGPGWRDAILAISAEGSAMRAAQLARLARWRPPDWAEHFAAVERFLEQVVAGR